MLWVPQKGRLMYQSNLGTTGVTAMGTSATTGGAASTKGSYAECIASTSFDAYWVGITLGNYSATVTNNNLMVDIAVGAATEEIIIADLMGGGCSATSGGSPRRHYMFPLYIPAGSRITTRGAGQRVSTGYRTGIELWGGDAIPPFRVGRKVTTYGVGTVPTGTTIVPGTSGAAGAHTQIVASTTENHFAFVPGFQPGDDTTKNNGAFAAAIGVGAATEEELSTIWFFGTNSAEETYSVQPLMPAFADVPAATRLSMRFSSSLATLDAGNYNGTIYAIS